MDEYLKQNRFRMRNEVGLISDFYKSTNQDYIVHCEVREGKAVLVNLDISVPDKEQAEIMCNHWKDRKPRDLCLCDEIFDESMGWRK